MGAGGRVGSSRQHGGTWREGSASVSGVTVLEMLRSDMSGCRTGVTISSGNLIGSPCSSSASHMHGLLTHHLYCDGSAPTIYGKTIESVV